MIINNTPLRTSKNYNINNIEINFNMPKKLEDFTNYTVTGDTSKFIISNEPSVEPLKYGNGKDLEKAVLGNGNQKIKIEDIKSGTLNLEYNLNEDNSNLLENIEIVANTKSKTTIVIKYLSDNNQGYFHNGIIRVNANSNSTTNVIIVNMLNEKTVNLLSIENIIEENARVDYTIVDLGGNLSATNYYSKVKGNGAKSNIKSIYLGKESQFFDINYIVEIFGKNAETNIDVKGALKDAAKKNFKGTIDFKKGCKKSKGNENEFCMLLSDKARSKALPMLLCTEEEIEGNHSSSAGKIDDGILFYIQSRGISEKDAMKLIVKAKFNRVLENIKDEELKKEIINKIDKKLD